MSNETDRKVCHTPTPGKKPTSISRWKYVAIRAAILKVLPDAPPGIPAKDLPQLVKAQLSNEEIEKLGSIGWHTTTVKLNMEVEQEIARHPTEKPQHIFRT